MLLQRLVGEQSCCHGNHWARENEFSLWGDSAHTRTHKRIACLYVTLVYYKADEEQKKKWKRFTLSSSSINSNLSLSRCSWTRYAFKSKRMRSYHQKTKKRIHNTTSHRTQHWLWRAQPIIIMLRESSDFEKQWNAHKSFHEDDVNHLVKTQWTDKHLHVEFMTALSDFFFSG